MVSPSSINSNNSDENKTKEVIVNKPEMVDRSNSRKSIKIKQKLENIFSSIDPLHHQQQQQQSIQQQNPGDITNQIEPKYDHFGVNPGRASTVVDLVNSVECTSEHEGRQYLNLTLPINIDKLMTMLFFDKRFFTEFHEVRKNTNLKIGDWTTNESGRKCRLVTMAVNLNQTVGPKYSLVTENHILRDENTPGKYYGLDIHSTNAGIPYADTFELHVHYCLTSKNENHTNISVFMYIKFKKSLWGVVKGLIEKNVWSGSNDYFSTLKDRLEIECDVNGVAATGSNQSRSRKASTIMFTDNELIMDENAQQLLLSDEVDLLRKRGVSKIRKHSRKSDKNLPKSYKILNWIIFITVLLLILLNMFLYLRLQTLERDKENMIILNDFKMLKILPKSQKDWLKLLRAQDELHWSELLNWKKYIISAAELLKNTERTLIDLLTILSPPKDEPNLDTTEE